ncbi:MAG: small ribosomal subunit Rsm22 family protein [Polyangiales bacterium]
MTPLAIPVFSDGWIAHVAELSRVQLGFSHLHGARLSRAVADISHTYTRERTALAELRGDGSLYSARLQFFLSRDLLKIHGPLAELGSVDALPRARRWRVLDLGAGLGATSLGVARFAALSGKADSLEVCALDIDPEALELYAELARDVRTLPGAPITLQTYAHDLTSGRLPAAARGPFDLIVTGFALNELAADGSQGDALQRILAYAELLSEDGSLIILEPALRETSRALHALRDRLGARAASPFVFAPCLHTAPCPMLARERDFCHERIPYELPPSLAALAASAGLRERDLTYSYLTLHRQARSLRELGDAAAPGSDPARLYRAVSGQLASKGKREVWLCGPSGAPRAMRLDRHARDHNAAFEAAERGCVASFSGVADSDGARLRVTAESHVALVQAWTTRDADD